MTMMGDAVTARTPAPDTRWIEMAGRRHGLSIQDIRPDGHTNSGPDGHTNSGPDGHTNSGPDGLEELEHFILAAGMARDGALLTTTPGAGRGGTQDNARGGCLGQQPGGAGGGVDGERSYFLVNPGTGGMDRVALRDWLPRLQSVQEDAEGPEPAGTGMMDRRMRLMQGRR